MRACILASGFGSRLGGDVAKPMVVIRGRPVLEHTIRWLVECGITKLTITVHHQAETIMNHFGDGSEFRCKITYSIDRELGGTASDVKKAMTGVKRPFLVWYGDNLSTIDPRRMLRVHEIHDKPMATIASTMRHGLASSGVMHWDSRHHRLKAFHEKELPKQSIGWVNAGIYILEPTIFKHISDKGADFGRHIFPERIKSGSKLVACPMIHGETFHWYDTPADLEKLRREIA